MCALVNLNLGQFLRHHERIFALEQLLALELEVVRAVVRLGVPMLRAEDLLAVALHDHDDAQLAVALGAPQFLRLDRFGRVVVNCGCGNGGRTWGWF